MPFPNSSYGKKNMHSDTSTESECLQADDSNMRPQQVCQAFGPVVPSQIHAQIRGTVFRVSLLVLSQDLEAGVQLRL